MVNLACLTIMKIIIYLLETQIEKMFFDSLKKHFMSNQGQWLMTQKWVKKNQRILLFFDFPSFF